MLIAGGVVSAIAIIDLWLPVEFVVSAAFVLAAVVASAMTTVTGTALVAGVALAFALLSGFLYHNTSDTMFWLMRVTVVSTLGVMAVVLARSRVRRERELRHMTVIAEAVQRALIGTMPISIGSLRFAARSVSATNKALAGGDLYEVVETADSVRIIVGDSRGKGLDAVQMAATVLAAFRREAPAASSLPAVAISLDDAVSAVAGDEDFVTAVLAEFHHDGTMTVVNCGHHPPLVLIGKHDGRLMDTGEPQPPLGFRPTPKPVSSRFPEGSRVLLYTDGLVEARNHKGSFFPLVDRAVTLRQGSIEDAVDELLRQVVDHASAGLEDDMALVLVERQDCPSDHGLPEPTALPR